MLVERFSDMCPTARGNVLFIYIYCLCLNISSRVEYTTRVVYCSEIVLYYVSVLVGIA